MPSSLSQYSEFFIFAAACVAAFGSQGVWLGKTQRGRLPWLVWILAGCLLALTWNLADQAGTRERQGIEERTGDFARLYADEMQRRGHAGLAIDARPDDPLYLDLIETEKRWLALNPSVNDIYTLRKLPDGRKAFLVDSETDYNHDGKYEGEREMRTPIGEVYNEADAGLDRAFRGLANFDFEPVTDRWGTWVSAFVPLRTPNGRVEGVLGVDFDAHHFARLIALAKWRVIGLMALVQSVLLGSSTITSLLRAESDHRQRAHAALRESEERFRQMAENIREIFWMGEPDGSKFHYVSPSYEQVCARSLASLHAQPNQWNEAILAEDRPRVLEAMRGIAAGQSFEIEYRILRPDGSARWLRNRGFPVRDNAGVVRRACGLCEDVTARKKAEAELANIDKQLREASRQAGMAEVATNVLHNVGNVLNSVNTSISVASDKVSGLKTTSLSHIAELVCEHRDVPAFLTVHPQGMRLPQYLTQLAEHFATGQTTVLRELESLRENLEHINEIVAMQQSYAGGAGLLETLPLAEVISDALRIDATAFERHGMSVACELDSALPPVTVDRNKLLITLVNLVRNAKHACDESEAADKRITLRTQLTGSGRAAISVTDNGIGIPSENLTRIFAHGFTTRKGGHGFGLHSSALAVADMGGSLRAHSDGPGHGATFSIELPLTPAHS